MNKFLIIISSILVLLLIILSSVNFIKVSTNDIKEVNIDMIRIVDNKDKFSTIGKITDSKEIKRIIEILQQVKWSDDIKKPETEPDYSFWMEQENNNIRVENYDIWYSTNTIIIYDNSKGQYGFIQSKDETELKNLLKK